MRRDDGECASLRSLVEGEPLAADVPAEVREAAT